MIAILHNIRSLHNVGSIFRTADAAGVEKLYLCGITPAPVDRFGESRPQIARVALGAERTVAWKKMHSAARAIDRFRAEGHRVFAVEQNRRSVPYYRVRVSRRELTRTALLVGAEVKGLPESLLKKCDKILEIPMRGAMVRQAHHPRRSGRGKESLNVAVAFGIVAFHLRYSSHHG